MNKIDPDGRIWEAVWDIANVVMDVKSLSNNIRDGNYGEAAIDAGATILDVTAAILPIVPGGAGVVLKVEGSTSKMDDVISVINKSTNVKESVNTNPAFKNRVKLRKDVKEAIRNSAPKAKDGSFIDPNTNKKIKKGQEVFGHKTGNEWKKYKKIHRTPIKIVKK